MTHYEPPLSILWFFFFSLSLSHHFSLNVLQPLWWHGNNCSLFSKPWHRVNWLSGEMMARMWFKPHLDTKRGSWLESYWALRADLASGLLLFSFLSHTTGTCWCCMYNVFHLLTPQPHLQHLKLSHTRNIHMLFSPCQSRLRKHGYNRTMTFCFF